VRSTGNWSRPFEYFWNKPPDLLKPGSATPPNTARPARHGRARSQAIKETAGQRGVHARSAPAEDDAAGRLHGAGAADGAVKAWVGSRDYSDDNFDHVQQAGASPVPPSSPSSTARLRDGHQPNETLMDQPVEIQIDRNKVWRPTDIEGAPTGQPMTLRDGLAQSKNTITAQLMMQVGPSRVAAWRARWACARASSTKCPRSPWAPARSRSRKW
jgi:penicillin-binding protein 1A